MTQDEIIKMACQAFGGLIKKEERDNFVAFAKLVAAKERENWPAEMKAMENQVNILTDALGEAVKSEREACAKLVENYMKETAIMEALGCLASVAYDIRTRGEKK